MQKISEGQFGMSIFPSATGIRRESEWQKLGNHNLLMVVISASFVSWKVVGALIQETFSEPGYFATHSYVESKGNNVAVLDNVVLAFQP